MPAHHSTGSPARGQLGARVNLSRFVRERAEHAAEEFGFPWIGVPEAASTYPQLRGAFAHSQRTGDPLPVSNLYCEGTIFVDPSDNVAFRFWHDTAHCRLGYSFELPDEWELTLWHLQQLEADGLGPSTTEYELLRLDLLGQIILLGIAGRFPLNQGEFSRTCDELGLDAGILHELRRIS